MQLPLSHLAPSNDRAGAHVVPFRCRHGYHSRFNRLAPQATPTEVRAGVIHGRDETPLPPRGRDGPWRAAPAPKGPRSSGLRNRRIPRITSTALGTAGAGAGLAAVSPSPHVPAVSTLQTRAPGSRTGIAVGHHPAANLPVIAQTRRETTGSASDVRADRPAASPEHVRTANTPSVPERLPPGLKTPATTIDVVRRESRTPDMAGS